MVRGDYVIWLIHFVHCGESNLWVIENSLMSLGGQDFEGRYLEIEKSFQKITSKPCSEGQILSLEINL